MIRWLCRYANPRNPLDGRNAQAQEGMGTEGQEKGVETTGVRGWRPWPAADSPINIYEVGPRWGGVQSQGRYSVKGNPRAADNGEVLGKRQPNGEI